MKINSMGRNKSENEEGSDSLGRSLTCSLSTLFFRASSRCVALACVYVWAHFMYDSLSLVTRPLCYGRGFEMVFLPF
jgi:hypothetical protein